MTEYDSALLLVKKSFIESGIEVRDISVRRFPGESIYVVQVDEKDFVKSVEIANSLDAKIDDGFITVKKAVAGGANKAPTRATSLIDPRVNALIETLNARSRTSEQQPSLRYIADVTETSSVAASRRHHLIFGRRGVGKTALMLEAKQLVEGRGATTFWANIQTMRSLSAYEAFLTTASRLCDLPQVIHASRKKIAGSLKKAETLKVKIDDVMSEGRIRRQSVHRLIPEIQQVFQLLCAEIQADVYLFLDDFHYLAVKEQPIFLDMIHAITRDTSVWIKAAGIKHQARWFSDNPPTGLQVGHDAAIINLDVTLEQPAKAKKFLSSILQTYADEVRLGAVSATIAHGALDRLVLASGGVPRDFLLLGATAIQVARQRTNARTARVQDVNEAAGRIAQIKRHELEDDAASAIGMAKSRVAALKTVSKFLLEEKQVTYFRVDLQDKEAHSHEYDLLQSLMDLRFIHLINAGLSDERQAGRKSEVYMLDLSQFSGTRFKRNLKVLDFTKSYLVLKDTGGKAGLRLGDSPSRLQGILRRGPLFELSTLTPTSAVD